MTRFLKLVLIPLIGIIFTNQIAFSQGGSQGCNVTLNATGLVNDSAYCGIPITLNAVADTFTYALNNNFNTGTLGAGWTATSGVQFNNPCGASPSGAPGDQYLWMGNQVPIPRTLTTIDFDVACGGSVCFDIRYAVQGQASPCEGPDLPEEGVTLQYQTCPTCPWVNIIYMNASGLFQPANPGAGGGGINGQTLFTSWGTYCFTIPPGAETLNTKFRWIQEAYSSQANDHWGLDNVQILSNACGPFYFYWNDVNNLIDTTVSSFTTNFFQDSLVTVTLTNNTNTTCRDTILIKTRKPDIKALATDSFICKGQTIQLNGYSSTSLSGQTAYYKWDWTPGDFLNNDTIKMPFCTPDFDMFYQVSVINRYFPTQCSDTSSILIRVNIPESTTFTSTDETCPGYKNGTATATVNYGSPPFYYYWYVNPLQITQTAINLSPGFVRVKVTDSLGCNKIDSVYIHQSLPFNFDFAKSDDQCLSGNNFSFIATGTQMDSVVTDNIFFNWNFGDNALNYFGESINYSYSQPGDYTVTLITTNEDNCWDTVSKTLTVYNQPNVKFNFQNACKQSPVLFSDSTSVINATAADSVILWNWTFGDNSIGTGNNPQHYYGDAGSYNVKLIVETAFGCIDSISETVQTYRLPIASFSLSDICEGQTATFNDLSNIGSPEFIDGWNWNFGDGNVLSTSTQQNPMFSYASEGQHTVTLVARSNNSCRDTVQKIITVHPNPNPNFAVINNKGCEPHSVLLFDSSSISVGSIVHYNWNFGDSNTSKIENPEHTYFNDGNFNITLTATSAEGCSESITLNNAVEVWPKPEASFDVSPSYSASISNPNFVFTNTTVNGDYYVWNYDNSAGYNPNQNINQTITYQSIGAYNVNLIATNIFGCVDTIAHTVYVESDFSLFVPNAFTPNGDNLNDSFNAVGEGIADFQMKIFDRWGTLVFTSDNIEVGWDAKKDNGNEYVKEGVYAYKINILDKYGKSHEFIGQFVIIR